MSCSDILLSFLADMGDDWSDNFQFSDFDAENIDLSDYNLKPPPSFGTSAPMKCSSVSLASMDNSSCSSPVYSNYSNDSESDEDIIYDLCSGSGTGSVWNEREVLHQKMVSIEHSPNVAPFKPSFVPVDNCASKKRKFENVVVAKKETIETKKAKQTPEEKVVTIIGMIRKIKNRGTESPVKDSVPLQRHADPAGAVNDLLKAILASKSTSPQELLKVLSPTATLHSTAFSSLHSQAQSKRTKMNLNAWVPVPNQGPVRYPEQHKGVGQIAAACRAFSSSIADLLSGPLFSKVKFSAALLPKTTVISASGDRLASNFLWTTVGLVELGLTSEIEINGLIRCSFSKDGISSANISFDAYSPVRQCSVYNA